MPSGTLATARDNVPYDERGDFKTLVRSDVQEATRLCQVRWADRKNFIKAVLPQVFVGPSTGFTYLVSEFDTPPGLFSTRFQLNRLDPEPHPSYPWMRAVEAEEVGGKGWPSQDPVSKELTFNGSVPGVVPGIPTGYSIIAVKYKTLPYNVTPPGWTDARINDPSITNPVPNGALLTYEWIRYTKRRVKSSGKNQILPKAIFNFLQPTATPKNPLVPFSGSLTVPWLHMAYTWMMTPIVPPAAASMIGCVNSQPFDFIAIPGVPFPNFLFAIGTILYEGSEVSDIYYTTAGMPVVDITYHLVYNRYGWNFAYDPKFNNYYNVFRNPTGVTPAVPPSPDAYFRWPKGSNIYNYADLNMLFAALGPAA